MLFYRMYLKHYRVREHYNVIGQTVTIVLFLSTKSFERSCDLRWSPNDHILLTAVAKYDVEYCHNLCNFGSSK